MPRRLAASGKSGRQSGSVGVVGMSRTRANHIHADGRRLIPTSKPRQFAAGQFTQTVACIPGVAVTTSDVDDRRLGTRWPDPEPESGDSDHNQVANKTLGLASSNAEAKATASPEPMNAASQTCSSTWISHPDLNRRPRSHQGRRRTISVSSVSVPAWSTPRIPKLPRARRSAMYFASRRFVGLSADLKLLLRRGWLKAYVHVLNAATL